MITNAQRVLKFFKWLEQETDYGTWIIHVKKAVENELLKILDEQEKPILEDVACPECGGKMTSRKNRETGSVFWGCNSYPNCRGTRDNMGRSKAERDAERDKERTPGRWNVT